MWPLSLQGLVTNDVTGRLPCYAALLSAQGKHMFDFLVWGDGADLLIDCEVALADDLARRLTLLPAAAQDRHCPRRIARRSLERGKHAKALSPIRVLRLWGIAGSPRQVTKAPMRHGARIASRSACPKAAPNWAISCGWKPTRWNSMASASPRAAMSGKEKHRADELAAEGQSPAGGGAAGTNRKKARQRAAYPDLGLAVDHLRVEKLDPDRLPDWQRPGVAGTDA